jgi:hypothetical protein
MSKAHLVITAVIVQGRSQGEAARAYGVSQGWVSRLVARYRAEGEAPLCTSQPCTRWPNTGRRSFTSATTSPASEMFTHAATPPGQDPPTRPLIPSRSGGG